MNNIVNELLKEIIESTRVVKEERDPQHASYEQKGRPVRYVQPRILQTWGDPNGIDTPVLKRIAERMEGATSIAERIEKLNQFMAATLSKEGEDQLTYQEGPAMGGQVGTKIATIMYLEVFYALVTQFEAAPAGFLLESILAGTFGGQAITDVEGGSLPITDIKIPIGNMVKRHKRDPTGDGDYSGEEYVANTEGGDAHYSLKLLTAKGLVKGSYTNLVKAFFPEDRDREPINELIYLVVEKTNMSEEGMDLVFHEFKINRKNWFDWIGPPAGLEDGMPEEKDVPTKVKFTFDPKELNLGAPVGYPEGWAVPLEKMYAIRDQGFSSKTPTDTPPEDVRELSAGSVWILNKDVKHFGQKITRGATLNLTHEREPASIPTFKNWFSEPVAPPPPSDVGDDDVERLDEIKITGQNSATSTAYLIPGEEYTTEFLTGEKTIPRSMAFKKIYTGSTGKKSTGETAGELKFQEALKLLKLEDGESFESYISRKGYVDDPGFGVFLKAVPGFTEKGGEKGGEQFTINSAYHKGMGSEIGTLSLQAPKLREVAVHYADELGETIKMIYNCLDNLTNDIQNYFLKEEGLEHKRQKYGEGAIEAASCVIDNMTKQIGGEGAAGDEAAPTTARDVKRGGSGSTSGFGGQEESKKPIDLDKLIEQMINKKFN